MSGQKAAEEAAAARGSAGSVGSAGGDGGGEEAGKTLKRPESGIASNALVDAQRAKDDKESGDGSNGCEMVISEKADGEGTMASGWLWKRGNARSVLGAVKIGSDAFKQRFCVCDAGDLSYFLWGQHGEDGDVLMDLYMGEIDLQHVTDAKVHEDPKAPGPCMALVTKKRTYILSSESGDSRDKWLAFLRTQIGLCHDARAKIEGAAAASSASSGEQRAAAGSTGSAGSADGGDDDAADYVKRRERMDKSVSFKGACKLREKGMLSTSYNARTLVLTSQTLSVFTAENDMYDEDKDALVKVALSRVTSVCMRGDSAHSLFEATYAPNDQVVVLGSASYVGLTHLYNIQCVARNIYT